MQILLTHLLKKNVNRQIKLESNTYETYCMQTINEYKDNDVDVSSDFSNQSQYEVSLEGKKQENVINTLISTIVANMNESDDDLKYEDRLLLRSIKQKEKLIFT
ncbi:hypothetical protein H311_01024 [Anncaliia algerae PRA109]|nr:hypothetical protein H311_01024 [Anncaliia algerae PRA109]